ncbi:HD family hydrolase [Sodalis ligni]|uniref:HD family hydrolase n=1 Tax=Sodalis ligni TaxID=2697027 RepID=UPI00193FB7AC|nr:HD family hydrolase [Sodalis ligni]QWA09827.1 HD family hydrolase [Sodalis ligni]
MTWITTFSGHHFDYADPDINSICISDIAHALSNECRYAGHCPQFYSVAQHSVLTSMIVPPAFALEALLHDAAEAYCKDIPSPLKALLPSYRSVEARIDAVIRRKFGLPAVNSPEVKDADLIMLATERRDLEIDPGTVWPMLEGIPVADLVVFPLTPCQAERAFFERWDELNQRIAS